jgi:pimeloyl-ACP methyl ester carboxylesterase
MRFPRENAKQPETRYAKCGDLQIAYQMFGTGAGVLMIVPPFVSNVENYWDEPDFARWLLRLGSFTRVVMFDKRGTGLSDRAPRFPALVGAIRTPRRDPVGGEGADAHE